ncbi:hypothetical protein [Fontivita pretiosa]|uniref:hypothetical protein n=1 Tax=Fontivita pretiosa TaxID=2989684 RepID=UPI003D1722DF
MSNRTSGRVRRGSSGRGSGSRRAQGEAMPGMRPGSEGRDDPRQAIESGEPGLTGVGGGRGEAHFAADPPGREGMLPHGRGKATRREGRPAVASAPAPDATEAADSAKQAWESGRCDALPW